MRTSVVLSSPSCFIPRDSLARGDGDADRVTTTMGDVLGDGLFSTEGDEESEEMRIGEVGRVRVLVR